MSRHTISILIPDGQFELAILALRCLGKIPHVRTLILANEPWPPVRFSRHQRYFAQVGDGDERLLAAIKELAQKQAVDVLLPVSEQGIAFMITHQDELSKLMDLVPAPALETFNLARNKWTFHQFALASGLDAPPAIALNEYREGALRFPALLKPFNQYGGHGILLFQTAEGLQKHLDANPGVDEHGYFLQSYITGRDFGISALCHDGQILAITTKRGLTKAGSPFGPQMAMQYIHDPELSAIAAKIFSGLNWSGLANIDLIRAEGGGPYFILEMNARVWGGVVGSLSAGINFPYLAALTALGIEFPPPEFAPITFMHSSTALAEMRRRVRGRGQIQQFYLPHTGLWSAIFDPLPEIVRKSKKKRQGASAY